MKLKKIIPMFILIILLGALYSIKAMDSNINFENLPGDIVGEILKNMANPESISNITQADINRIKSIALLRKDAPGKVNFKNKVDEALKNLKNATCQYLNKILNHPNKWIRDPKNVIATAKQLGTEFSKLCLKELMDANHKIDEIVTKIFFYNLKKYQQDEGCFKNAQEPKWIKFLIETDPNIMRREVPLIKSAYKGEEYAVDLLLEIGANPNIQDKKGYTALMRAAMRGEKYITRLLLWAEADPNIKNKYGNTALIEAAINGKKKIVKILLEAGANPSIKNDEGKTAYKMALDNGYEDIAELLIKQLLSQINKN